MLLSRTIIYHPAHFYHFEQVIFHRKRKQRNALQQNSCSDALSFSNLPRYHSIDYEDEDLELVRSSLVCDKAILIDVCGFWVSYWKELLSICNHSITIHYYQNCTARGWLVGRGEDHQTTMLWREVSLAILFVSLVGSTSRRKARIKPC
jgi:hypothetical protein